MPQFLGLCNFFQGFIWNFVQHTALLTSLTKKDVTWKRGQLPHDALRSFLELQFFLCSEPKEDYPHCNCPNALIMEASLQNDKKPSGLGAMLTLIDSDGQHCITPMPASSYRSMNVTTHHSFLKCKLPFWGIDLFGTYLGGHKLTLITDH